MRMSILIFVSSLAGLVVAFFILRGIGPNKTFIEYRWIFGVLGLVLLARMIWKR